MDVEPSGDLRGRDGGVAPTQPSDSNTDSDGSGSPGGRSALHAGDALPWWHPDSSMSRAAASVCAVGAVLMGLLHVGLAVASGVGGNWGEGATRVFIAAFFGFCGVQIWRLYGAGRTRTYGDRGGQSV